MAVDNALKFYKGWYGTGSGRNLPNVPQALIFNEEEGILYLNGHSYSGATDVNFDNGVLTISYSDGRQDVSLDFRDTASASASLKVFERIENIIGPNVNVANSDGKLNYEGTYYLDGEGSEPGAETLVEADKILDEEIKNVNDRIDDLDATNVQGVTVTSPSGNNGVKLTFNGITETDGQISAGNGSEELQFSKVATTGDASDVAYDNTSQTGMENVSNVQGAIENINSRLNSIETVDTFNTIVSTDAASTPAGATWVSNDTTITGSLTADASTMHKIYLVPDTSTTAEPTGDYKEYISVRTGTSPNYTYTWELIGSTKADLTDYVKEIVVNGKTFEVSNGTATVTIGDVITGITGEETTDLNNTDFVNVKVTTVQDTTNGTNVTTLESSVKTETINNAADEDVVNNTPEVNGLATALDVKHELSALESRISNILDGFDATIYSSGSENEPVIVSVTQTNGELTDVDVTVLGANVSFDSATGTMSVAEQNGVVLGSDVSSFLSYIDNKVPVVTSSDTTLLVTPSTTNGKTTYDVNLVWTQWGEQPQNNG